ncbi:unnamed protein product [Staurois parvus]|uniref:Uncharacterized protein n=1 Tax=Staurois parvus TaxID=386267 RepID=A0ABN9A8S8_9NEOB|nr:unnamed protein product [Staurois parvus]
MIISITSSVRSNSMYTKGLSPSTWTFIPGAPVNGNLGGAGVPQSIVHHVRRSHQSQIRRCLHCWCLKTNCHMSCYRSIQVTPHCRCLLAHHKPLWR